MTRTSLRALLALVLVGAPASTVRAEFSPTKDRGRAIRYRGKPINSVRGTVRPRGLAPVAQRNARINERHDHAAGAARKGTRGFDLVMNLPKVQRDRAALRRDLTRYADVGAQREVKALMLRGYAGYVYGDLGSMGTQLRELTDLNSSTGAKVIPKAFQSKVYRYAYLVEMQHGLSEAAHQKMRGNDFLELGLGRAIRAAKSLNVGSGELLKYLNAYGLTRHDVEQHTQYRFAR